MKLSNILNALGIILVAFGIIMLSPIVVAVLEQEYSSIIPFITASLSLLPWGCFSRNMAVFPVTLTISGETRGC